MLDAMTRTPDTLGATQCLAEFTAGVSRRYVPDGVRAVLQAALIDAVGCALFGLTTPAGRIVSDFVRDQGGPPEASIWGSGGARVSAANSAIASGTAIHSFDFDDHHRAKLHLSAAVLPAAFAMAERAQACGATLLAALAAGYEVMARISLAANPNAARMRGWHLTGTCGSFGAAAAACVILGLDGRATASALGLAGTQSAGLWAFNADGAMSKRIHPGFAARNGITAALLAQRGFHGPRMILEAEDGGFLGVMSDEVRISEIGRELGRVWRAANVCFKPYACCGSNHASIDAALSLMAEYGFGAADVLSVTVGVSHVVERQTGFAYRMSTVLNAQMSLRYNLAVALIDGQALLEQFTEERIADPVVNELIERIEVEISPEMDAVYPERYAGIVTINLRDGRILRKRVDYSKGMPENRMTEAEIKAKFLSLATTAIDADEAHSLLADLTQAFEMPNIVPLADWLGHLSIG